MIEESYLADVRAQYEQFPFPNRRAEDEGGRLVVSEVDRLAKIDHHCFDGRRDYREPMRILIAGGGTGDALVYLAEQLRDCPCEFVYLDLSQASMATAQARMEARGLRGVRWVQGSILEIPGLDLGRFDYINCVGVLHHLADPDAGLGCLRGALTDDGGMGLMVYGRHGRRHVYVVQEMMKLLCADDPSLASRLQTTRSTLTDLSGSGVVAIGAEMAEKLGSPEFDTYLVDTYLHQQDRPYSAGEIHALLTGQGLHLSSFTNFFSSGGLATPLDYDPTLYFSDPTLIEHARRLSRADRHQLAEILCSTLSMHAFYASAAPKAGASLTDVSLAPYFPSKLGFELGEAAGAGTLETLDVTFQSGLAKKFRLTPVMQAVVAFIDGRRPTRELATLAMAACPDMSRDVVVRQVMDGLDLLLGLGVMLLRDPDLPPLERQLDGAGWTGSINWRR